MEVLVNLKQMIIIIKIIHQMALSYAFPSLGSTIGLINIT